MNKLMNCFNVGDKVIIGVMERIEEDIPYDEEKHQIFFYNGTIGELYPKIRSSKVMLNPPVVTQEFTTDWVCVSYRYTYKPT